MNPHEHNHSSWNELSWLKRHRWVTYLGLVILTYFLLMEHRDHVFQFLPYLIFLACPLMHIFMHKGHDHGHSINERKDQEK